MQWLIAAPANNERGPRYMEKALAAIHQAGLRQMPITLVYGPVGGEKLGKHPGQLTPENLTCLPKYVAYARLLIDGLPSSPFSIQTLPPPQAFDPARAEIIRRVTRRRIASDTIPATSV